MKLRKMRQQRASSALGLVTLFAFVMTPATVRAQVQIPVAHVYHNHMPNFWSYYANDNAAVMAKYNSLPVGAPINYTYDGFVIDLKNNLPSGYPYMLPSSVGSGPMPHDDLVTYYSANAKYQCYQSNPPGMSGHGWPMQTSELMQSFSGGKGQVHVTFSAALANNVNSLELRNNVSNFNEGSSWNSAWLADYTTLFTSNGFRTMDLIHFAGHHSLGPLVGQDFLLKDLISHGATMAQPFFLGGSYQSSHGFFPTELSFSERLIPVLTKLGIQWSVLGNNHFSRALQDYPYSTYDATGDAADSPPNRADLRDASSVGSWVSETLQNQAINIVNKFPFASTPHWVRYVDPVTGAALQVAGIPVSQVGEWAEGFNGSVTVAEYVPYASLEPRQFYVIAHDGDNSSGKSGSLDTWEAGVTVTGSGNGFNLGIDEYLKKFPIPSVDVQHAQDGSWPDVLDSSTDPMFYHWHLPFEIWSTQFSAFNAATGMSLAPKKNLKGVSEGTTVTFENGWHFQELAYAKLQPPLNYARTAEQIWLDKHTNYWSPSTGLDNQVTHAGNQLNPWMIANPVKGDPANDYRGGANPAELAWYFLLPGMDSGFGYFGENQDDDVKPVLAFNNSLAFSQPYVQANLAFDRTGPSVWIPQRYPGNPGSVNASKAEGWTIQWYNNHFAFYTYAADVSGMGTVNVMVRPHTSNTIIASDDTYKVYHPSALAGASGLSITPGNVSSWTAYPMQMRDLHPVMNGVAWVPADRATMQVVPAMDIGNLYYAYLNQYRNQLIDYYVQATDSKGNIANTDIQQVFVGAGTYSSGGKSGFTEDPNGSIQGVDPFITAGAISTPVTAMPDFNPASGSYPGAQSVQILDGTSGSAIHYTTDGSTPNASSPQYSGAVLVNSTTTIRAIAITSGLPASSISAATYIIGSGAPTPTPTPSPNPTPTPAPTPTPTPTPGCAAGLFCPSKTPVDWDPTLLMQGKSIVIYYQGILASGSTLNMHYGFNNWASGTITDVSMSKRSDGFFQSPAISLSGSTTEFDFVFNNGAGTWDNNNGQNWILKVLPASSGGETGCTTVPVTFSIANANTVLGQNLYVAGNQTALGNWAPANAFSLAIQGSGANATWSGTAQLPPGTPIQYKYIKFNPSTGAVIWENNQNTGSGNRQAITPACGVSSTLNDGSF